MLIVYFLDMAIFDAHLPVRHTPGRRRSVDVFPLEHNTLIQTYRSKRNGRGGSVYFCGMTAGGRQLSKAVRPIAQREIPAFAGMTWEGAGVTGLGAGMTRPGGNDGESNLLRPGRNPCRKSKR